MACIKLLVGLTIAINMGFIVCEKYGDLNLPEKTVIVPIRYNVIVNTHSKNLTFSAEVTTGVNVDGKIYYVVLHVPNQIITNHPFIERGDGLRYKTDSIIQRANLGIIELHFKSMIDPGFYRLVIQSLGFLYNDVRNYFDRSYFVINQNNDEWLFAPVFQPVGTQALSQCWNKSEFKTFFNISINHHQTYVAFSNMFAMPLPLHKDDGTITTVFATTPKISPYHVMIMITKLNYTFSDSVDIVCRSQIVPHLTFGKAIVEKVEEELESYTINSWIIPKLNLIVVPGQVPVMAKWGFIIYREKYFIYDKNIHSVNRKINIAIVIARGLVYQWIANVANPSSCTDMWLNEALASFFQMYILDKSFPDWRIMDFFVVYYQQLALRDTIDLSMNPITNEINGNNIDSRFKLYSKGPFLLRMMQHLISEELFRIGIIKFVHKHHYHSATPDIFWDTMQEVLHEKKTFYTDKLRLKDIMNNWLTQEDYPVVHVTRDYHLNTVFISQSNFNQPEHEKNGSWMIPITFTTQSKPNFSNTMSYFLLNPKKEIWISNINKHDWIIINLQQSGYYRVSYDYTNWHKIACYLNSDDYTKIHVLNRAQIIDDAYHLMVKNKLDPIMFLQLMGYLKLETDYVAWYPMRSILPKMWSFSQFLEGLFIKQHILQIWDGLLDDVKYMENPDDDDITKIKRMFAIKWACSIGHNKCREETNVMLNKLIANFTTKTILSPLEKVICCTGMMVANITTWTKVLARYIHMQDKELLKYLACSENQTIIMFYLETMAPISSFSVHSLNKTEKDIHTHHEIVYREIIRKHSKKNLVLEYILSNFMRLKPSKISAIEALEEIIKNVQHKHQIIKIKKYLQANFISGTIPLDPTASLEKADNLLKERQNELKKNLIEFKRIFKML